MVSFREVVEDIAHDGRRSSRTIRKFAQEALDEHEREQAELAEQAEEAEALAFANRPIVRNGPAAVATFADGAREQVPETQLRRRGLI